MSGNHLVVGIRWAKNHQFGRELLTYPLPILHTWLCPLKALRNVRKYIKPDAHDPLFRLPSGDVFTYRMFQARLRRVLVAVGVDQAKEYSSHSFRRGGATFAYLCGVPAEIIKILGNWKSDCYLKYLHLPLEARIAAAELVKFRLLHMKFKY